MPETISVEQLSPVLLYYCAWHNHANETVSQPKYTYAYKLFYLDKGSCEITINEKTHRLEEHMGFFLPPNEVYTTHIYSGSSTLIYNIWFDVFPQDGDMSFIDALSDKTTRHSQRQALPNVMLAENLDFLSKPHKITPSAATQRIFGRLFREQEEQKCFYAQFSNTYLHQILLSLLRDTQVPEEMLINSAAQDVMNYIEQHITEDLNCERIALACSYHQNYINRVIKRATGMTFHRYLIDAKLRAAAELLVNTEDSITSIAYHFSFSNAAHFTNLFTAKYRMPPSDYRRFFA